MNNFKKLSAIILTLCTATTVFYSCDNIKPNETTAPTEQITEIITEIITEKETVNVELKDENGNISVFVSEKIITIPVTKSVTVTNSKTDSQVQATETETNGQTVQKPESATTQTAPVISTVKAPDITTKKNITTVASTAATTKQSVKTTKAPVITTVKTTKRPVVDDKINEKSVGIFMLSKTDPVQIGNQANVFIQGTPGKTYSIEFYETPSSVADFTGLENKKADANGMVSWTFEIKNTCNAGKRKVVIKESGSDNYLETSITVK